MKKFIELAALDVQIVFLDAAHAAWDSQFFSEQGALDKKWEEDEEEFIASLSAADKKLYMN